MKIKNCLFLITGVAALLLATVPVQAQTNESAPSFFSTAQNWLTSVDTNYTFTGVTFEASTGYKQEIGINAASYIDAQYDISRWNIGGEIQFSGVGSAVNEIEGQVGYAVVDYYSVKLEADFRGGYDAYQSAGVIEPVLMLKKKLTTNTYAETGVSLPEYLNQAKFNSSPSFFVGGGFTF